MCSHRQLSLYGRGNKIDLSPLLGQYEVCYSLLGTAYGGDGTTTFALPDLRWRESIGLGQKGERPFVQGRRTGKAPHQLEPANLPVHSHTIDLGNATVTGKVRVQSGDAGSLSPIGTTWAAVSDDANALYSKTTNSSTMRETMFSVPLELPPTDSTTDGRLLSVDQNTV